MKSQLTDKHKEEFMTVLGTLDDLERKILLRTSRNKDTTYADVWVLLNYPYLRFGTEEEHQLALIEIGTELGLDLEQTNRLEAKALRKLCHPSRVRKLQDISPTRIN